MPIVELFFTITIALDLTYLQTLKANSTSLSSLFLLNPIVLYICGHLNLNVASPLLLIVHIP